MTETCMKHSGNVVSVVGDKLTTTCREGHQHCYTMSKNATVTCNGLESKAADMKIGSYVRVAPDTDDQTVATAVESGKHVHAQ